MNIKMKRSLGSALCNLPPLEQEKILEFFTCQELLFFFLLSKNVPYYLYLHIIYVDYLLQEVRDVLAAAVRPANLQGVRPESGRHDVHNGTHTRMAANLGGIVEHPKAVGKIYRKEICGYIFV